MRWRRLDRAWWSTVFRLDMLRLQLLTEFEGSRSRSGDNWPVWSELICYSFRRGNSSCTTLVSFFRPTSLLVPGTVDRGPSADQVAEMKIQMMGIQKRRNWVNKKCARLFESKNLFDLIFGLLQSRANNTGTSWVHFLCIAPKIAVCRAAESNKLVLFTSDERVGKHSSLNNSEKCSPNWRGKADKNGRRKIELTLCVK